MLRAACRSLPAVSASSGSLIAALLVLGLPARRAPVWNPEAALAPTGSALAIDVFGYRAFNFERQPSGAATRPAHDDGPWRWTDLLEDVLDGRRLREGERDPATQSCPALHTVLASDSTHCAGDPRVKGDFHPKAATRPERGRKTSGIRLICECRSCPMKRRRALPGRECRFAARLRVDSHIHVRHRTERVLGEGRFAWCDPCLEEEA
jgi:hypothetical protein